jgi:hypothetical protein
MDVDEEDINEIPNNNTFSKETAGKKKTNIYTIKSK